MKLTNRTRYIEKSSHFANVSKMVSMMTSHPILFQSEMVRAILDGRKTQTRRIIKPQPANVKGPNHDGLWSETNDPVTRYFSCPYGVPGDELWVKETFRTIYDPATCREGALDIDYRADGRQRIGDKIGTLKWKPSIFMPRWASRITLEVVDVRVERVREMSNEDAQAEGIQVSMDEHSVNLFANLWDSINRKTYPWASNPLVWRIEFRRIK